MQKNTAPCACLKTWGEDGGGGRGSVFISNSFFFKYLFYENNNAKKHCVQLNLTKEN